MKRDWNEIAMLAALTDFLIFGLVGFPLAIIFDSPWPAIAIISPVLIWMLVFIVVSLVGEWRRVLR